VAGDAVAGPRLDTDSASDDQGSDVPNEPIPLEWLESDNDEEQENEEDKRQDSGCDQGIGMAIDPERPDPDAHARPDAVPAVPQDRTFEPRANTDGHRKVCEVLLPVLLDVLRDAEWARCTPRDQVRQACRSALGQFCHVTLFSMSRHLFMSSHFSCHVILSCHVSFCSCLLSFCICGTHTSHASECTSAAGVDLAGDRFWGNYLTYSRKRTAEDVVACMILVRVDA
jgi:hypothetical protein